MDGVSDGRGFGDRSAKRAAGLSLCLPPAKQTRRTKDMTTIGATGREVSVVDTSEDNILPVGFSEDLMTDPASGRFSNCLAERTKFLCAIQSNELRR